MTTKSVLDVFPMEWSIVSVILGFKALKGKCYPDLDTMCRISAPVQVVCKKDNLMMDLSTLEAARIVSWWNFKPDYQLNYTLSYEGRPIAKYTDLMVKPNQMMSVSNLHCPSKWDNINILAQFTHDDVVVCQDSVKIQITALSETEIVILSPNKKLSDIKIRLALFVVECILLLFTFTVAFISFYVCKTKFEKYGQSKHLLI